MPFKEIILAMDLSLSQPGFAVLAITDENKPILLETSTIKTKASMPHSYRLGQIGTELERYLQDYDFKHVVREKGFSRFPKTTQTLFKVVGTVDYILGLAKYIERKKGLPDDVTEISVKSVKKLVADSGKASKEDVAFAVFNILDIDNTVDFYTKKGQLLDDKTDAVAVGLAYMIQEGLIDK